MRILVFISVNLSYFIAKRLAASKKYKNSVSAPIIKIAVAAVAISIVMMLVSVATGLGLQQKIRDKITSFNGHVVISNYDNNQSEITLEPISTDQDRKSTRLNSSHVRISYAVFCLKKKKK